MRTAILGIQGGCPEGDRAGPLGGADGATETGAEHREALWVPSGPLMTISATGI
jgi:hypothetical protein